MAKVPARRHPGDRTLSPGMAGMEKGISAVDLDPPEIETDLIDLTATSLHDLCDTDRRLLEPLKAALFEQLGHPRLNLGGGGPPGRID